METGAETLPFFGNMIANFDRIGYNEGTEQIILRDNCEKKEESP